MRYGSTRTKQALKDGEDARKAVVKNPNYK